MKSVAIVFVRRTGADGIGHVGWGFTDSGDIFCAGSVENPHHTLRTSPQQMGFWAIRTRDPIAPMQARLYTELKVIDLAESDPAYAWQVVSWCRQQPYDAVGRNCMDVTYDVLRAFGVADLPVPAHHWEPNHWFDHIQGRHYQIDRNDIMLLPANSNALPAHTRSKRDERHPKQLRDIAPAIPAWRQAFTPEWQRLRADLAVAHLISRPELASLRNRTHSIVAWMRGLFGISAMHL